MCVARLQHSTACPSIEILRLLNACSCMLLIYTEPVSSEHRALQLPLLAWCGVIRSSSHQVIIIGNNTIWSFLLGMDHA